MGQARGDGTLETPRLQGGAWSACAPACLATTTSPCRPPTIAPEAVEDSLMTAHGGWGRTVSCGGQSAAGPQKGPARGPNQGLVARQGQAVRGASPKPSTSGRGPPVKCRPTPVIPSLRAPALGRHAAGRRAPLHAHGGVNAPGKGVAHEGPPLRVSLSRLAGLRRPHQGQRGHGQGHHHDRSQPAQPDFRPSHPQVGA